MKTPSPATLSQERLLAIIQMHTEIAKARLDLGEIMNLVAGRAMVLIGILTSNKKNSSRLSLIEVQNKAVPRFL